VDIWALGVLAYQILSGELPWRSDEIGAIVNGEYSFDSEVWGEISDLAQDFIMCLLVVDPFQRPRAEDALTHAWFAAIAPNEVKPEWAEDGVIDVVLARGDGVGNGHSD
jgi:serine/threonine protein kinase